RRRPRAGAPGRGPPHRARLHPCARGARLGAEGGAARRARADVAVGRLAELTQLNAQHESVAFDPHGAGAGAGGSGVAVALAERTPRSFNRKNRRPSEPTGSSTSARLAAARVAGMSPRVSSSRAT